MSTARQHPRGSQRAAAGLTLLEMLVGLALASLLVTALTSTAVMFSRQTSDVRSAPGHELERVMAEVADAVRYAWLVQQPATDEIVAVDPYGNATSFGLDDGDLVVRRPDGRAGVLLPDVESFDVSVEAVSRLREGTPVDAYGTWLEMTEPAGTAEVVVVEENLPLALGFTLSSIAPEEHQVVEGLPEQTLLGTLETLELVVAYVGDVGLPPDGSDITGGDDEDDGGADEGEDDDDGKGKGDGKDEDEEDEDKGGKKKVTICHIPPGNPENAKTLRVGESAADAHFAHGDTEGPCGGGGGGKKAKATLVISLHEARAPDDGRPYGPALASMSLPATRLPAGTFTWNLEESGVADDEGKVLICHVPPGNPAKAHAIRVAASAVPAHLSHGDILGSCVEGEDYTQTWSLSLGVPGTSVTLDLAELGQPIEPTRAYTLVVDLQGPGTLLLRGVPTASPYDSAVAQKGWAGGAFEPRPLAIARSQGGMRRFTQTEEHRVPSLVRLFVEHENGRMMGTSAAVANQTAIANRWYGAAPGEWPDLLSDEN